MKFLLMLAGLVAVALAMVYFTIPADSLPLPDALGHQVGSQTIHIKHGIAALVVGVACLVLAWRKSTS
jgi:hypothetical protein